jgi:hypothetical protein
MSVRKMWCKLWQVQGNTNTTQRMHALHILFCQAQALHAHAIDRHKKPKAFIHMHDAPISTRFVIKSPKRRMCKRLVQKGRKATKICVRHKQKYYTQPIYVQNVRDLHVLRVLTYLNLLALSA